MLHQSCRRLGIVARHERRPWARAHDESQGETLVLGYHQRETCFACLSGFESVCEVRRISVGEDNRRKDYLMEQLLLYVEIPLASVSYMAEILAKSVPQKLTRRASLIITGVVRIW